MGEFIPGTYHLPSKKITENGTFNGHLNFDFRESHSETVDVAEDYDQSFINIKFKGASKLSDKSEKFKSMTVHSLILILKIWSLSKTKDITISATGKAKGKTFSSETKTISADDLKDNTKVTLEFDSDKINSYVGEERKRRK